MVNDEKSWNDDVEKIIDKWIKRTRESQHSHHEAGKYYKALNYWFSVPVIAIGTLLGGAALYLLGQDVNQNTILIFGAGGILTALLSAIQTHFNFAERGAQHSSVGARYGYVRRELEQLKALPIEARGNANEVLTSIREKLDALGSEGPVVSRKIFEKSNARLAAHDVIEK